MSHEGKLSAAEHCDSARISLHFRQRFALFKVLAELEQHPERFPELNAD